MAKAGGMTFVTQVHWDANHKLIQSFDCAVLDRRKNMTAPFPLSRADVLARLQAGETFHVLEKISCRWDVGPQLEVVQVKGHFLFSLEAAR